MSAVVREIQILALLDSVADPVLIRDVNTPQGLATEWLLSQDSRKICPDDPKILQRWVLAVMYFSTGGEQWLQCSNNILATDDCGNEEPFEAEQRFLSAFHECEWAGIDCNELECVTEIEFGKTRAMLNYSKPGFASRLTLEASYLLARAEQPCRNNSQ